VIGRMDEDRLYVAAHALSDWVVDQGTDMRTLLEQAREKNQLVSNERSKVNLVKDMRRAPVRVHCYCFDRRALNLESAPQSASSPPQ
jgi:hypothetical protein